MAERAVLILDASVAVKWFNPEPLREEALAIRRSFVDGDIELESNTLLHYELTNALRYNPRFGIDEIKASIQALNDLQLTIQDFEGELAGHAIETAYRFGITMYDAAYVALAVLRKGVMYTADEGVVAKVSQDFVKHLSEFRR